MSGKTSKSSAKAVQNAATGPAAGGAGMSEGLAKASGRSDASERIDRKIAELGDWRGERLADIRRLIHEADPEVVEEWKWRGAPVWSHGGIICVANAFKDKVKLTFYRGASIPDPDGLFNNGLGGKQWRSIDLSEGDKLREPELKRLVRAAVDVNLAKATASGKGRAPAAESWEAEDNDERSGSTRSGDSANSGKPRLLSGGNPQIPKADGDAPVQAYIEAMPGWKSDVGRRLDALIERNVPNVRKAVRWNSPFYGVEGQGWFLSYHCFTKYVKVVFLNGASLRPLPPVESKHPYTRYFHIHEGDQLDEELLVGWIKQASELPGDPLF